MTNFKKSDWLRHLYREAIKWLYGLKGNVQWHGLTNASDPNNGKKLPMADLVLILRQMLQTCLEDNKVPTDYIREVTLFMEHEKKIDTKLTQKAVTDREMSLALKMAVTTFENLPKVDQDTVVAKLECLEDIEKNVQILIQVEDNGSEERPADLKPSKHIDLLRHIYGCCQKWLANEKGQAHWKDWGAEDPNNSKNGSKMKLDELTVSLKALIPQCFEKETVPKKYFSELEIFMRNEKGTKLLEREERLRKVAGQLEDTLGNLEFDVNNITKVSRTVKHGALLLNKALKDAMPAVEVVARNDGNFQQYEEDGTNIMLKILEQGGASLVEAGDQEYEEDLLTSPGPILHNLSDQTLSSIAAASPCAVDAPLCVSSPVNTEHGSDSSSESSTDDAPSFLCDVDLSQTHSPSDTSYMSDSSVLSPSPSVGDRSGYVSVDSGIHSPEHLLFDEDEDLLKGIDDNDLDYEGLPDFELAKEDENEEELLEAISPPNKGVKRKLSFIDGTIPKKARP